MLSTKRINLYMRLGVGSVSALLVLGVLYWMNSPRITGRQILGTKWPQLISDGNYSLTISGAELEKCRGPIAEMLRGNDSVIINGRQYDRAEDSHGSSMFARTPDGTHRQLVSETNRMYWSEDMRLVWLKTDNQNNLDLMWQSPMGTHLDINLGFLHLNYHGGPKKLMRKNFIAPN